MHFHWSFTRGRMGTNQYWAARELEVNITAAFNVLPHWGFQYVINSVWYWKVTRCSKWHVLLKCCLNEHLDKNNIPAFLWIPLAVSPRSCASCWRDAVRLERFSGASSFTSSILPPSSAHLRVSPPDCVQLPKTHRFLVSVEIYIRALYIWYIVVILVRSP